MTKCFYLSCIIFLSLSCQNRSVSSKKDARPVDNGDGAVFKAHLAPVAGSKYAYSITNESTTELEVNGKTVNTLHKSDIGITYDVQKDSAGNYVLGWHYDKIHLYSKTVDNETELDASNATATLDPTEKMMGLLKEASITATISPTGKVMAIGGYKELGEKMLADINADANSRNIAKTQWEKIVGDGMVKKSIEQLFSVLPDTNLRIGDTWQKSTQQKGR